MGILSRSLSIFFVLSLFALPLAGCDNPPWEAGMTLSLKVDAPKNGTTVNTSTVTVSGRVLGTQSQDAKLTINGTAVPIKERKYSTSVTLTEGANAINVAVTAAAGTMKEQVTVTYAPAK